MHLRAFDSRDRRDLEDDSNATGQPIRRPYKAEGFGGIAPA